jgi:hypothetical protein
MRSVRGVVAQISAPSPSTAAFSARQRRRAENVTPSPSMPSSVTTFTTEIAHCRNDLAAGQGSSAGKRTICERTRSFSWRAPAAGDSYVIVSTGQAPAP